MADCKHRNVQQWTECCLDCGQNIYEAAEKDRKRREIAEREDRRRRAAACAHRNVQQWTEVCLDCGVNIYERFDN